LNTEKRSLFRPDKQLQDAKRNQFTQENINTYVTY